MDDYTSILKQRKRKKISVRSCRYRLEIITYLLDGKKRSGTQIAKYLGLKTAANASNILLTLKHELLMERNDYRLKCKRHGSAKMWWLVSVKLEKTE